MKKQSFLKGTVILMTANAISKLLGAIFKIPLCYLLREEGMAIYQSAFTVYVMILSFTIGGIPLALSKTVAEDFARHRYGNIRKTVRIVLVLLFSVGLLGSLLLWKFPHFFALAMKEPKAAPCIRLIAPSVLFVAIGTVFKSYYQGKSNMTPTALSQVLEAAIKLLAGYALAHRYAHLAAEYTAAAAIFGVTIGELLATLILALLYLPDLPNLKSPAADRSTRAVLENILGISVPVLIASGISAALNLAELAVIRTSLTAVRFHSASVQPFLAQYATHSHLFDTLPQTLRLSDSAARWLYGAYSGYALTVFHLPVGILATLGTALIPVISGALAVRDQDRAVCAMQSVAKYTLLLVLAASCVLFLFSDTLLEILFHTTAASEMLRTLTPCLIFLTLTDLYSAVLNASGKIITPFLVGFFGSGLKILLSAVLIRVPALNVRGIALGADLSYFATLLCCLLAVRKEFSVRFSFPWKELCSAAGMFLSMCLVHKPFSLLFRGDLPPFVLTVCVGFLIYLLALFLCGALSAEDFAQLKSPLPKKRA